MRKPLKKPTVSELGHAEKTIFIEMLQEQILLLKERNQRLEKRLKELEGRIKKNSSNSSKPPSSDIEKPNKTKSTKQKSDKKPGGQPGRKGSNLRMHENPDEVIRFEISKCNNCGNNLKHAKTQVESRQEFEIPEPSMRVTEYQAESRDCKCCGYTTTACFPENITHQTQYGPRARSLMVYMNQHQFIPYHRASQFFEAVYGHKISPGTIVNAVGSLANRLTKLNFEIKDFLAEADLAHCDETSMSVNGTKHWLHTVGTDQVSHFALHKNRGQKATLDIGILPKFEGTLVHDHWKSYFRYQDAQHALCNAHHLRELRFIHEHHHMKWAKLMSSLLLEIKEHKNKLLEKGKNNFTNKWLATYTTNYRDLLVKARREQSRRGTLDSHNLIKRFSAYEKSVLFFMHDFTVPFTNNLSEQDLRMSKVKQKISGCFRNVANGNQFCKIRSFLISSRKNTKNPFLMIQEAFRKIISLEEIMVT
jgi:transposase